MTRALAAATERALLAALNDEQRAAVVADPEESMLVSAGAGTGKTLVLVSRLMWLALTEAVALDNLCAMTFTVRAARELSERLARALPEAAAKARARAGPWPMVGTYHSTCARIVRRHAELCEPATGRSLTERFTVLDENEQQRGIEHAARDILDDEHIDKGLRLEKHTSKLLASALEHASREGLAPSALADMMDADQTMIHYVIPAPREGAREAHPSEGAVAYERNAADVLRAYEAWKSRHNAADYADLIRIATRLMEFDPRARPAVTHLLADECQDTDEAQWRLIDTLRGSPPCPLFAVGDSDQIIYEWRGASIQRLLHLQEDHTMVARRLHRNYRSPAHILDVANAALNHNRRRTEVRPLQSVHPRNGRAPRVACRHFPSAQAEARWITSHMGQAIRARRRTPASFAILCRTAASLQLIDVHLARERLPYIVMAGRKFAMRAEIKDVAAWLRLLCNPSDSPACERILLNSAKGFGAVSMETVRHAARDEGIPIIHALTGAVNGTLLNTRARRAAEPIVETYFALAEALDSGCTPPDMVEAILENTDIRAKARKATESTDPDLRAAALSRLERLEDLRLVAREITTIRDLTDHLALSDTTGTETPTDVITLATVHQAKGAEWDDVVIAALEDDIFPSASSQPDPGAPEQERELAAHRREEERRVLHVAATRARRTLTLTLARTRSGRPARPSPFLQELGETIVHLQHQGPGAA